MVVAPSPSECSSAVASLVALVAPLSYAGDFRPFYTIQDPSFANLAAKLLPDPSQGALASTAALASPAERGAASLDSTCAEKRGASSEKRQDPGQVASIAADPTPHVLGLTNLFILKSFPSWPHVLSVGTKDASALAVRSAGAREGAQSAGMLAKAVQALRQRRQGPLQVHC